MNKDLIFKVIKPHLNSKKELTYSDFESLFSSLENQEKYAVCDLLFDLNIELVDEKSTKDPYEEDYKKEDIYKSTSVKNKKILNQYKNVSNEYLVELYQRTKKDEVLNTLIKKNQK